MRPYLHHQNGQLFQSYLFNPFNNNKNHFLFSSNTSNPAVLFMYSHYVPLILFFSSKNAKNKVIRNQTKITFNQQFKT